MGNKTTLASVLAVMMVLACNLSTPSEAGESHNTQPAGDIPTEGSTPLVAPPSGTRGAAQIFTPAAPVPPSDVPFYIDCSAIDPSREADCDRYLANTRDLVYPILQELTGTSLSTCYDAVYYTIVPDEQLPDWQGQADNNRIIYSLRSSLNAAPAPLYDSHELLHTIASCSWALDDHFFHGPFESHVDLTLTGIEWQSPGRDMVADWLERKLIPDMKIILEPTARGEACKDIFRELIMILYYDSGIETIKTLYRSTIPGSAIGARPSDTPGPNISNSDVIFAPAGNMKPLLTEAIKGNTKHPVSLPECGI